MLHCGQHQRSDLREFHSQKRLDVPPRLLHDQCPVRRSHPECVVHIAFAGLLHRRDHFPGVEPTTSAKVVLKNKRLLRVYVHSHLKITQLRVDGW